MYWLYGQSVFSFIMLFQTFFKDARTAAVVITIIYFGTAMSFNVGENAPTWKKFMISLSPTACMTQTLKVILGLELNGLGVTMGTLDKDYRNFNCRLGFLNFFVSFILLTILWSYFEHVLPREPRKT